MQARLASFTVLAVLFSILSFGDGNAQPDFRWAPIPGPGTDPSSVLEVTSSGHLIFGAGRNLFRSVDNGASWSSIPIPKYWGNVQKLTTVGGRLIMTTDKPAMLRMDDDGTHISVLSLTGANLLLTDRFVRLYAVLDDTHIAWSIDYGDTWDTLQGPPGEGIVSFAADLHNLYVGSHTGLYVSSDHGSTWQRILNGVYNAVYYNLTAGANGRVWATGYDGGAGVLVASFDYGIHWFKASRSIDFHDRLSTGPLNDVVGHGFYMADSTVTLISTPGQIYTYDSSGRCLSGGADFPNLRYAIPRVWKWQEIPNPLSSPTNLEPALGTIIATFGSSVYSFNEAAETWSKFGQAANGTTLVNRFDNSLMSSLGGSLSLSFDSGRSWRNVSGAFPPGSLSAAVSPRNRIYAATRGVYFSDDSGTTWTETTDHLLTTQQITSLAVDSVGILFVSTASSVYKSTNDGREWIQMPSVDGSSISGLTANASGGVALLLGHDSVMRSIDAGATWSSMEVQSSVRPTNLVLLKNNSVVVAGDFGVRYASPAASVFYPLLDGLDSTAVTSVVEGADGTLYAASRGRGVLRGSGAFPSQNVQWAASEPMISVYPNPGNEYFRVPIDARCRVDILDQLGRTVKSLATDPANNSNVDIRDLAEGAYTVYVTSASNSFHSKLIVQHHDR